MAIEKSEERKKLEAFETTYESLSKRYVQEMKQHAIDKALWEEKHQDLYVEIIKGGALRGTQGVVVDGALFYENGTWWVMVKTDKSEMVKVKIDWVRPLEMVGVKEI